MKDGRLTCTICKHPERVRIEMARLAGCSLTAVAERFDVGRDAIHRHMQKHLTEADRAALISEVPIADLRERAAEEDASFLDYLGIARKRLLDGVLITAEVKDWTRHAALQGRFIELLKLHASYTGELRQFQTNITNNTFSVTLTASSQYAQLTQVLVSALTPHPDALHAVMGALRDFEGIAAEPADPLSRPLMIDATPAREMDHV